MDHSTSLESNIDRKILNKVLLLKIFEISDKWNGQTKLQLMIFLIQIEGRKRGIATFNYEFIEWIYGPTSDEIGNDIKFLINNKFIYKRGEDFGLIEKGKELVQKHKEYINLINIEIITLLEEYYQKFKDSHLEEILQLVKKYYSPIEKRNGSIIISIISILNEVEK